MKYEQRCIHSNPQEEFIWSILPTSAINHAARLKTSACLNRRHISESVWSSLQHPGTVQTAWGKGRGLAASEVGPRRPWQRVRVALERSRRKRRLGWTYRREGRVDAFNAELD